MPQPGFFVLHRWAKPPLKAGPYVLHAEHDVADWSSEPLDSHITVTAPRYTLPPDQLLGVYPPANASGEFAGRLPQIVMRRRTLPWERDGDPNPADPATSRHPDHPWVALVVLRSSECTLLPDVAVAEALSPGVHHSGERDVDRCACVEVPTSVVNKVFPAVQEIPLLTHLREVDQRDTELAMGDDDGWLAVVMANRLPMSDTGPSGEPVPVRYLACLVSLEGQFHLLPPPPPPRRIFDNLALAADTVVHLSAADPDHLAAAGPAAGATAKESAGHFSGVASAARKPAGQPVHVAGDWQATTAKVERVAAAAVGSDAGRQVRLAMVDEFIGPASYIFELDAKLRFPVLAYWTFTTTGSGGFESYMQHLDVGLLGTTPRPPAPPPAAPPGQPATTPPPPPARPALETVDTGHVGLAHLTRRGDRTRAWYRGPLVPRPTERSAAAAEGHARLAHVSDQLRVITPDGREDLSRAGAFEIGRLLALSQPSVVAALLRWRTEQFGAQRAAEIAAAALPNRFLDPVRRGADLGRLVTMQLLDALGDHPLEVVGPVRPVIDPGRPLRVSERGEELETVARGLGVDLRTVIDAEAVVRSAALVALADAEVPVAEPTDASTRQVAARLSGALTARVSALTRDVMETRGTRSATDPLGGLLARLEREENS